MEPESVHIIAYVFIVINSGVLICAETYRYNNKIADNIYFDAISRGICPSNVIVSVLAMFGAQKKSRVAYQFGHIQNKKSVLLLPFLGTLALLMVFMTLGLIYTVTVYPYELMQLPEGGKLSPVCGMSIIMGATCIAGILFGTCQTYIVLSLYKFIRYGADNTEDNPGDIELTDKLHDNDDPSTSY